MKLFVVLVSIFVAAFQDVPFKAKDEFELKLDYQFKPRPKTEAVEMTVTTSRNTPLPFLSIQLNVLTVLDDEYRVRIVDGKGNVLGTKVLAKGRSLKFDVGYTDDVKDRVSSDRYIINFHGKDKKINRNIVIRFDTDGGYFVNDEQRGRI